MKQVKGTRSNSFCKVMLVDSSVTLPHPCPKSHIPEVIVKLGRQGKGAARPRMLLMSLERLRIFPSREVD